METLVRAEEQRLQIAEDVEDDLDNIHVDEEEDDADSSDHVLASTESDIAADSEPLLVEVSKISLWFLDYTNRFLLDLHL